MTYKKSAGLIFLLVFLIWLTNKFIYYGVDDHSLTDCNKNHLEWDCSNSSCSCGPSLGMPPYGPDGGYNSFIDACFNKCHDLGMDYYSSIPYTSCECIKYIRFNDSSYYKQKVVIDL